MTEPVVKEWFRFADENEAIQTIIALDQKHGLKACQYNDDGSFKRINQSGQTWAIAPAGPFRVSMGTDENGNEIVKVPADNRFHVHVRAHSQAAKNAVEEIWPTYGIEPPDHPNRGGLM